MSHCEKKNFTPTTEASVKFLLRLEPCGLSFVFDDEHFDNLKSNLLGDFESFGKLVDDFLFFVFHNTVGECDVDSASERGELEIFGKTLYRGFNESCGAFVAKDAEYLVEHFVEGGTGVVFVQTKTTDVVYDTCPFRFGDAAVGTGHSYCNTGKGFLCVKWFCFWSLREHFIK